MPRKINGKIVLAPFPFDDLSSEKVRPALRLTKTIGIHRQTVLAYITSQTPAQILSSDFVLDESHPEFTQTGLLKTSTLRLHLLYTIANENILRELGQLPESLEDEVLTRLRRLFNL